MNRDGLTPTLYAIKLGASAILRVLMACGADVVHQRNAQRFPPLLLAAECAQINTFSALCQELEKTGQLASAAKFVGNGYNCLHFSVINNDIYTLGRALKYDAFKSPRVINQRSTDETTGTVSTMHNMRHHILAQTPLHKAVRYGFPHCLRLLLEAGADPNGHDGRKQTPVHSAALGDHYECLALLLRHGAKVDSLDAHGQSAIDAIHPRQRRIAGLLASFGAKKKVADPNATKSVVSPKSSGKKKLRRGSAPDRRSKSPTKARGSKKKHDARVPPPPPPAEAAGSLARLLSYES